MKWFRNLEQQPQPLLVATSFGLLIVVGLVDYLTGFNISFSVFYLLAIGVAVWFVGRGFGFFLSVMSVVSWLIGDFAAGARFPNLFVPAWNAVILLTFYFIVVWLLARLRSMNRELESRVQQRSAALTREIAERERLEKELLDISEREQRQIGHDLHDSLGQHLTSTAMAAQVLREKLDVKAAPEAGDAARIVALVEDGIAMARELARGLSPVELEAEGLMSALQELAASISKWSKVACALRVRIAGAHRRCRHRPCTFIASRRKPSATPSATASPGISSSAWNETRSGVTLSVEDDGAGLPENWQKRTGHRHAHHGASRGDHRRNAFPSSRIRPAARSSNATFPPQPKSMNFDRQKTKIFLVDDHPLVREWLTNLDQPATRLDGLRRTESAPAALSAIGAAQPDLAIVDISLKSSSGVELIKNLKELHPGVPVLVLVHARRVALCRARASRRRARLHQQARNRAKSGRGHPPRARRQTLRQRKDRRRP